jgi:hypothetical protein
METTHRPRPGTLALWFHLISDGSICSSSASDCYREGRWVGREETQVRWSSIAAVSGVGGTEDGGRTADTGPLTFRHCPAEKPFSSGPLWRADGRSHGRGRGACSEGGYYCVRSDGQNLDSRSTGHGGVRNSLSRRVVGDMATGRACTAAVGSLHGETKGFNANMGPSLADWCAGGILKRSV